MSRPDRFRNRVLDLFRAEGDHLLWTRLADDHIAGGESGAVIEPYQAYFSVRLTEMFLGRSRTLWRKSYPVVHAFSTYRDAEEHAVAGPGQLQTVTDAGLDRVITLNFRLAGPTPFYGGDPSIVAHDLTARLDAQETGNPFETKAWRRDDTVVRSPATIDFAEVAEYEDRVELWRMPFFNAPPDRWP